MCASPVSAEPAVEPQTFKVIRGLKTDVSKPQFHKQITLADFEKVSNYFECLLENQPCRAFIDLDGYMDDDIEPEAFDELVATIQERLVGCKSINGVRNSSHYQALCIDSQTDIKTIKKKLSFTLVYNQVVPSCKMLGDGYAVETFLPELKSLLDGVIEVNSAPKENALDLDKSVYRKNGKIRCPNAYKYPEQKERISKIVKGSMEDNIIQLIPEGCPVANIQLTAPAEPKTPKTPKPTLPTIPEASVVQHTTPAETTNHDDTAKELLKGLADKRYSSYIDWLRITAVVKNEKWDYEMYDKICEKRPRYNKQSNFEIYQKLQDDGKVKQATLWAWLKEDNPTLFGKLQQRRKDFYKTLDLGISDKDYAEMFHSQVPDRYFYSDASLWWECRPSTGRYYNTGKSIPIGITSVISNVLRDVLETQLKALNPLDEKTKERMDAILKDFRRLGDRRPLENIASFLDKLCLVEADEFDMKMNADTNLIAFKDCVYDLRTNEFRQTKPSDYISKTTRYNIGDHKSNAAKRTQVEKLLTTIFPDEPQKEYFLKATALAFFTNRFEMMHMLTGSGGNGKGVLTTFIKAAGGDYVFTADPTFLTSIVKGGQANSNLASCEGVRIVLVSEPNNGEKTCYMNEDFVKSCTGRDEINARFLFANVRTFVPLFTILLSCNAKPEIRKLDKALLRRLSIHPFLCSFKSNPDGSKYEKEGDSSIKDLKDDPAFIKEFMLLLLETAYANKGLKVLEMPELSKEAVNEYVEDNNQFKKWFVKRYKKVTEPEGLKKPESQKWCKENQHKPSDILKIFNQKTESRWTAQMLSNALKFNEIKVWKSKGYDYLRYYEEVPEDVESEDDENEEILEVN